LMKESATKVCEYPNSSEGTKFESPNRRIIESSNHRILTSGQ
jgi:hypothetical protein